MTSAPFSVRIAISLRDGRRWYWSSIYNRVKRFLFSTKRPQRLLNLPVVAFDMYWGINPGDKAAEA